MRGAVLYRPPDKAQSIGFRLGVLLGKMCSQNPPEVSQQLLSNLLLPPVFVCTLPALCGSLFYERSGNR